MTIESQHAHERALIVFGKNPIPGMVKTRLTGLLTAGEAAELYRAFLLDALQHYGKLGVQIRLYLSESEHPIDPEVVERVARVWTQSGQGLGERMFRAFEETLRNDVHSAVIVGTDYPGLPLSFLATAFEAMEADAGVIPIGPSRDGGYYLLGLCQPDRRYFEGIKYSTDTVFVETCDRVRGAGFSPLELPEWFDVDTPEDLKYLSERLSTMSGHDRIRAIMHRLRVKYIGLV